MDMSETNTTTCPKCGETLHIGEYPFCPHGMSHQNVISDEYIGGLTIENLAPTPITFYSKSEHRRYLKEHGIRQKVQHVGYDGTDKSPNTTRWI